MEHPEHEEVQIVPITNIAHVHLDDLVGYENAKKKLIDNTKAFVEGKKANNCLLFGDAGTGKSSSIKAILNQYYDQGLRMIEVYKHQFQDLNDVIAQIKNRNYKFIIYMDDLSFEEFEIEYKYLKAVIEGGLEKKPENVLIYATSNRRHLIRETFKDKQDRDEDMHTNDTVQEKLSLVARFGVTIYFGSPDKKAFQEIVRTLAIKNGISLPEEELLLEANKWELSHGGLSGRTAQQLLIICPDRSEYDRQKIPVSSKRYKRECRYKTGYEGRLEYRGEGRQEYRCKVAAILLLFVLTGMLAGCSGRMTQKRLLADMEENMQNVTSSANHVEVAIQMEDVLDIRNVNMALDLENTTQPPAGYAKGTAKVKIKNAQVSADLEIYQVQEDGKAVTYSRTNDSWVKETTGDSSESHLGVDGDISGRKAKQWNLSSCKEDCERRWKECYQMYGDVTGTELMGILGKDMVNAFHLVELPDEDAIRELKIPVILKFIKMRCCRQGSWWI